MIRVLVEEAGSGDIRAIVARADALMSSRLTYVETRSALARMRAGDRLNADEHQTRRRAFEEMWSGFGKVEVDRALVLEAANYADRHALRAYDAIQLASAATLSEKVESVAFACFDRELRKAAIADGLPVEPA